MSRAALLLMAQSVLFAAVAACEGQLAVEPASAPEAPAPGGSGAAMGSATPPNEPEPGEPWTPWDGLDEPLPFGGAPASRGELALEMEEVQRGDVVVRWPALEGARSIALQLGAEPSATGAEPLPEPTRDETLAADATAYTLENVAPGVQLFVRVEAQLDDDTLVWGEATVRTARKPDARRPSPIRAVHAHGPDVLLLVLANDQVRHEDGRLEGDLGASWQGGSWTVQRHDGTAVDVVAVRRHTQPVGQPDYPIGFGEWGSDDVVDLEHRVFLELSEPIGERELLHVRHEGDEGTTLSLFVPFSDRYLETPLIQVNQLGYNPRASRRWAYVSGWRGDGGAADLSGIPAEADVLVEPLSGLASRSAVLENLPVTVRSTSDAEADGEVREIDLAELPPAEGVRYRVRLPGIGVSWPTAVSEESALRAFYVMARGMYHNRWCGDLSAEHTEWSRPEDHCSAFFVEGRRYADGMFSETTPLADERPLRGGHHDAGDFDIRPYHVLVPQYLFRAYEIDPARYPDSQLTIPESGNGVPDLLDEALWSVAAWEALQNGDGSIRAGVESHAHPAGVYPAHEDELNYWTYDPEPWHTAYVAALFAQAANLVRPFDSARASGLEERARTAYASASAEGAPVAYRLYAAGELFRLTGETTFRDDFEAGWATLDRHGRGAFDHIDNMTRIYPGSFTGHTPVMADFVMAYATSPGADPDIVETVQSELVRLADEAAADMLESSHAHRNGRAEDDAPDWGHTVGTGRHVDWIYQALQWGDLSAERRQRYLDAASVAADYLLGCNPRGISFVTGLGSWSPRQPLHLDSLVAIHEGQPPVPGIPVYGPAEQLPNVHYYAALERGHYPQFGSIPPGRRYVDSRTAVTTSEFTVWEMQAPAVELFAALLGSGAMPPETWLPGQTRHRSTLPAHHME